MKMVREMELQENVEKFFELCLNQFTFESAACSVLVGFVGKVKSFTHITHTPHVTVVWYVDFML